MSCHASMAAAGPVLKHGLINPIPAMAGIFIIPGLQMNNHVMGYPLKQYACQVSAIALLRENTYQVDLLASYGASLGCLAGQHLQLELLPEQEAGMQSLSDTIANVCKPDSPQRLQLIIHKNSEFSG